MFVTLTKTDVCAVFGPNGGGTTAKLKDYV